MKFQPTASSTNDQRDIFKDKAMQNYLKKLGTKILTDKPAALLYFLPSMGIILSILSATDLCIGGCTALADYRLFKMPFGVFGVAFFLALIAAHYLHRSTAKASFLLPMLVSAGLGAEIWFIAIQKVVIEQWCPICLTIASLLAAMAATLLWRAYKAPEVQKTRRERIIANINRVAIHLLAIITGLGIAVGAVGMRPVKMTTEAKAIDPFSPMQPKTPPSKSLSEEDIWFGNPDAKVDVYIVSDWYCSFCRQIEPTIQRILPEIRGKARYTWVEYPAHRESLNIAPHSIAALLDSKQSYLAVRAALIKATRIEAPGTKLQTLSDAQIVETLSPIVNTNRPEELKERARQVFMAGVAFCRANQITHTPSVVVVNRQTNAKKILAGAEAISAKTVLKAISDIQKRQPTQKVKE